MVQGENSTAFRGTGGGKEKISDYTPIELVENPIVYIKVTTRLLVKEYLEDMD